MSVFALSLGPVSSQLVTTITSISTWSQTIDTTEYVQTTIAYTTQIAINASGPGYCGSTNFVLVFANQGERVHISARMSQPTDVVLFPDLSDYFAWKSCDIDSLKNAIVKQAGVLSFDYDWTNTSGQQPVLVFLYRETAGTADGVWVTEAIVRSQQREYPVATVANFATILSTGYNANTQAPNMFDTTWNPLYAVGVFAFVAIVVGLILFGKFKIPIPSINLPKFRKKKAKQLTISEALRTAPRPSTRKKFISKRASDGEKVFCVNCGKELTADWKFCRHCGAKRP